jgi:hypothetical protein
MKKARRRSKCNRYRRHCDLCRTAHTSQQVKVNTGIALAPPTLSSKGERLQRLQAPTLANQRRVERVIAKHLEAATFSLTFAFQLRRLHFFSPSPNPHSLTHSHPLTTTQQSHCNIVLFLVLPFHRLHPIDSSEAFSSRVCLSAVRKRLHQITVQSFPVTSTTVFASTFRIESIQCSRQTGTYSTHPFHHSNQIVGTSICLRGPNR